MLNASPNNPYRKQIFKFSLRYPCLVEFHYPFIITYNFYLYCLTKFSIKVIIIIIIIMHLDRSFLPIDNIFNCPSFF